MPSDATPIPEFRGRRPRGSEARTKTIGTPMTESERAGVLRALESGGFLHPSDGVRKVLFAYQHSTAVRDAVAEALRTLRVA